MPVTANNAFGSNSITLDIDLTTESHIDVGFAAATLHLGGRIDGTAGLVKRGAGVLTLTANNTYLGLTEIEAGTLVKGAAADVIPNASDVTVSPAATFALNGFHDEIIGALTLADGTVNLGNGTLTLQGALTMFGGAIDIGSGRLAMGSNLTATSSAIRTASITGAGRLDLGGSDRIFAVNRGAQATDLQILAVIHGAGFEGLTKTGRGQLYFGNDNTFRGITKVADGWLNLHSPSTNKSLNGLLVIGDGEGLRGSAGVRSVVSGENLSSNFAIAIGADGWLALNHLSETIGPLTIHDGYVTTGSATLTVDGLVSMRGGTIDMASAGTLRLGGDVSAISSSLGSARIISSFNGGTVSLNGATRTFTVDAGPLGIDLSIGVPVSGAAGLTKNGPGGLVLRKDSTYTGSTTVNEGTVLLFDGCIPGDLIIGDGAGGTANVQALGVGEFIKDTAAVTIKSDGLLDVNDRSITIGALTILGGKADIGHGTLTVNGALILDDAFINLDGDLDIQQAASSIQKLTITAAGNFANTIDLSQDNTPDFLSLVELNINAGGGNDTVLASKFSTIDNIDAGDGDDTIAICFDTVTVQGGNGLDTLRLDIFGFTLDLTNPTVNSRVRGIETIDLSGTGTHILTLNAQAVLDVSGGANTLVVKLGAGDTLNKGGGWTAIGKETINGVQFTVYTQGAATLKVNDNAQLTSPVRAITAQLFKKKVGGKVQLRVRVRFADTGEIKSEFKSPLQKPTYSKIKVAVMDSNADGAADLIVITGLKKGKKVTRLRVG